MWASPEAARESYAGHMLTRLGFERVLDQGPMFKFVKTLKPRKMEEKKDGAEAGETAE